MSIPADAAFTIEVPASRLVEYGYAATLLFTVCLETPVRVVAGAEGICRIAGRDGPVLSVDVGRGDLRDQALRRRLGSTRVDIPEALIRKGLPATLALLHEDTNTGAIEGDLLLSAFYLGSGSWELDHGTVDQHQRVQGKGSWLAQHGLISLPAINAYADLLKFRMAEAGATLPSSRRVYRRWITCDVDQPRDESCYSVPRLIKRVGRNIALERSLGAVHRTVGNYRRVQQAGWPGDPNNTFDYLMATNERFSNATTFFLICGGDHQRDASYTIDEPWMRSLMKSIHQRGHALGLHGSYDSLRLPGQLMRERRALAGALQELDIAGVPPGRQHYLRWFPGQSVSVVEEAGIVLDSSLGFHDTAGFRRGMCCAFPLFDLEQWRVSAVMEQPLVVMECAELGTEFNIHPDPISVLDGFADLARQCRIYDGTFTLLWHNSFLHQEIHRKMYEALAGI